MKYSVVLHKKPLQVEISRHAEVALNQRDKPIIADIHLIFGCMVAKRVWFKDQVSDETVSVTNKLDLSFRVVRYAVCSFAGIDGGAEPEAFPLAKEKRAFVPDYLFIDYRKRKFTGDFSFKRSPKHVEESLGTVEQSMEAG